MRTHGLASRDSDLTPIALEDSPPGVAAARVAGLYVLGVPSVAGVELEADQISDSLGDPLMTVTIIQQLGER